MRCRQIFFRLLSVSARCHSRTATHQHPNGASLPVTRTRPPRHLADLDPSARRAAAAELGGEPFRGDQLARHYFARLTDDPDEMTDLPLASRAELTAALLPRLLTAERQQSCDRGMTRKTWDIGKKA